MDKFFKNEKYSDFTFNCKEEKFPGHKMILEASPYFKTLFETKVGGNKDSIAIESPAVYEFCIGHLYGVDRDYKDISVEDFIDIIESAKLWEINLPWLEEFIHEHSDKIIKLNWMFAYTYFNENYLYEIVDFLVDNIDSLTENIIDHPLFKRFSYDNQAFLLNKYHRFNEFLNLKFIEYDTEAGKEDNYCYYREDLYGAITDYCTLTPIQKSRLLSCDSKSIFTDDIEFSKETNFINIKQLVPFKAEYYHLVGHIEPVDDKLIFIPLKDVAVEKGSRIYSFFANHEYQIKNISSKHKPLLMNLKYRIELESSDINCTVEVYLIDEI
jgi:hypothetical protein